MFELIIFKNYLFIITFLFDEFIELNKIENNKWKEERVVGDFGVEENKWKELEEGEWAWPKSHPGPIYHGFAGLCCGPHSPNE